MKRLLLLLVGGLLLLVAQTGVSSPLAGKQALEEPMRVPANGKKAVRADFHGGERACVIVKGDHKPVVDLRLSVYDKKGNLVAKDEGGGDYVAAIWYPPRDAEYRIEIFNPGKEYNDCYVSFK
jgi:hypothetical protein